MWIIISRMPLITLDVNKEGNTAWLGKLGLAILAGTLLQMSLYVQVCIQRMLGCCLRTRMTYSRVYDSNKNIDLKIKVSKAKVVVFDRQNGMSDCKLHKI